MDVFTLGDVAEILQVPKSRIKNWTIGRPLKIVPRVLAGKGKGSRNLYSLEDLYLFALVNQLYADGLSNNAIQYVVDAAFRTPKLGPVQFFSLTVEKGEFRGKFMTSEREWETTPTKRRRATPKITAGTYTLNVADVVAWVNHRITKLRGGN